MLVDAAAFAFWGFFWFVSFCYMADQWRRVNSSQRDLIEDAYGHSAISNIQAAIAFTFFSIVVWVCQSGMSYRKLCHSFFLNTGGHCSTKHILYCPWARVSVESKSRRCYDTWPGKGGWVYGFSRSGHL